MRILKQINKVVGYKKCFIFVRIKTCISYNGNNEIEKFKTTTSIGQLFILFDHQNIFFRGYQIV